MQTLELRYANGDIFMFKGTHVKNGYGRMTYKNGDVYEGNWKNNKRDGTGTLESKGKNISGSWKNDKPFGIMVFREQVGNVFTLFKGYLKNNRDLDFSKGYEIYQGQVKNDSRHGQGTYIMEHGFATDFQYEGEWKACLRHGQGSDKFALGDQYVGEYSWGQAHGYGQYSWTNGHSYSG